MPLDFPTSPTLNEIYTFGGRSWIWNGTAWDVYSTVSGNVVTQLNGLTGGVTLAAGSNITLTPVGNTITIDAAGGSGGSGITGPYVISFNGLTGAVTGVTTGTVNTFGPLQSFTNGISSAGGTFSALTRFTAGISASGGMTLSGSFQGSTAAFTGLVSSTVGFSGAASQLTATATNSASTFYPVFVGNTGNASAFVDTAVGPLSYIPLTSTLKFTNLDLGNGALTMNSTQITAAGTFYFIAGSGIYLQDENLITLGDIAVANEGTILEVDSSVNNKVKISATLPTLLEVVGGISASNGLTLGGTVNLNGQTFTNVISSINGRTGAVNFAAGSGITLSVSGNTFTIAATSSGGGSPAYGVTTSIDFSEYVDQLQFTIYGNGTDYGIDPSIFNKQNTVITNLIIQNTAVPITINPATIESYNVYIDSTYGWRIDFIVKPPYDTPSRTSNSIIENGGINYAEITYSIGLASITENWLDGGDSGNQGVTFNQIIHKPETFVTKTLTGLTWPAAGSFITCKVMGLTSADHTAEDAIVEGVQFEINNIVPSTGFDILGYAPEGTYGKYTIECLGQ